MSDKRRYLSRENKRGDKPVLPTGEKDAARDGYTIRSRQPVRSDRNYSPWGRNDHVAPTLKDEREAAYDIYLKD
jgi:hypothetical protein